MLELVRCNYVIADEFIDTIEDVTRWEIQTGEKWPCKWAAWLWKEIADYECTLGSSSRKFVVGIGEELFPMLFGIICSVDPEETDIKNLAKLCLLWLHGERSPHFMLHHLQKSS